METRANHVIIGAFILIAVAGALAFLAWASDLSMSSNTRYFTVLMNGPVRGLSRAADVLFDGLKVGKVRNIRISPDDTRKVEIVIWVEPDTPVRTNSRVGLTQQGLTGIAALQISPGSPDAAPLPGGSVAPYPAIAAEPVLASTSLTDAVPELLGRANSTVERVAALIAENEQPLHSAIKDLADFSSNLKSESENLHSILSSTKGFTDDLDRVKSTIASVGQAFDRLNSLVERNQKSIDATLANTASFTTTLNERRQDVATIIVNVRDLSEQLKRVSGKLETTLDQVSGLVGSQDSQGLIATAHEAVDSFKALALKLDQSLTGDGGLTDAAKRSLDDFSQFMREGQRAAATMQRTLDNFDHNPQSVIFGGQKVPQYAPQ
jgi:phospholipid/cholesterol/gamma-HCH transport system substrate-binding protein